MLRLDGLCPPQTKTLELGKQSDLILPFIGVHPEKAQDDTRVSIQTNR